MSGEMRTYGNPSLWFRPKQLQKWGKKCLKISMLQFVSCANGSLNLCKMEGEFYDKGIRKMLQHMQECIDHNGDYIKKQLKVQPTDAQEWHIVSLLGDVTSPTTAVHYVSITCSEDREALTGAPTEHGVYKKEFTVQVRSVQFATEQVGRLHYVTAVNGGLEAFPLSIMICAPVVQPFHQYNIHCT